METVMFFGVCQSKEILKCYGKYELQLRDIEKSEAKQCKYQDFAIKDCQWKNWESYVGNPLLDDTATKHICEEIDLKHKKH